MVGRKCEGKLKKVDVFDWNERNDRRRRLKVDESGTEYRGFRAQSQIGANYNGARVLFFTKLIDGCGKCGSVHDARKVFDQIPKRVVRSYCEIFERFLEEKGYARSSIMH